MDLAQWLRAELSARQWTADRLATELGVARPTVSKWTGGRTIPEVASCRRIARLFEIPTVQVLAMAGYLNEGEAPEPETPAERRRRHWLLRFKDLVATIDTDGDAVQAVLIDSLLDWLSALLNRFRGN